MPDSPPELLELLDSPPEPLESPELLESPVASLEPVESVLASVPLVEPVSAGPLDPIVADAVSVTELDSLPDVIDSPPLPLIDVGGSVSSPVTVLVAEAASVSEFWGKPSSLHAAVRIAIEPTNVCRRMRPV